MAPHYQGLHGFGGEKVFTPCSQQLNFDGSQNIDVYEFDDTLPAIIESFNTMKKISPAATKIKDCCISIDCVRCKKCDRIYKCPSDIHCHENNTCDSRCNDSIRCELCNKSFEKSEHLNDHLRKIHKSRTIVWKIGNEVIGRRTIKSKYLKSKVRDNSTQTSYCTEQSSSSDSTNRIPNQPLVFGISDHASESMNACEDDEIIEVLRISRNSNGVESKMNEESPTRLQREMLVLEAIQEIEKFQNKIKENDRIVPQMSNCADVSDDPVTHIAKKPRSIVGNQFTAIPKKTYLDIMGDMQDFQSDNIYAPLHSLYGPRYENIVKYTDKDGFTSPTNSDPDPLSGEYDVITIME